MLPLLARLIEAYECGPNRVEHLLRFRHLLARDGPKEANSRTLASLKSSDDAALQLSYGKSLHSPLKHLGEFRRLLDGWHRDNDSLLEDDISRDDLISLESDFELTDEEFEQRGDLFDNQFLRNHLESAAADLKNNPALKRALAVELGLNEEIDEFDLILRSFAKSENDSEKGHFEFLRRPKPGIQWSKEFIGRISGVVEREANLDKHPIASICEKVPGSIRILFEQAHSLYLLDFDIPCALTCGSLLEEAFEQRFSEHFERWKRPPDGAARPGVESALPSTFPQRIDALLVRESWAKGCRTPAMRIWSARNRAMHDPGRYMKDVYRSPQILHDSRDVIRILFQPNHS